MATSASALAFALLHSIWQGALLAAVAALTLRTMARASASSRHVVGMGFMIAMALAPVVSLSIFANADAPLAPGPLSGLWGSQTLAGPLMLAAWVSGIVFMLARRVAGLAVILTMGRTRYLAPPQPWLQCAERIRRSFRIIGAVSVRVSETILTPCVTQLVRPIVWLPATLATRMPSEQLEALIAHELAHIARKDWLWNVVQNTVETLLFYHPAVWWLSKRVRQEREHACDDLALAAGADPIALAEGLAGLAQVQQAPALALAASGGALLQRVTRLLAPRPSEGSIGPRAILGAIAMAAALVTGQVGIGGGRPHELIVEASTPGALGPGDYRQITAHQGGIERVYRASIDARGRMTEVYRVNGQVRPIDVNARRWLDAALR